MTGQVIIIVPAKGDDRNAFQAVAVRLKKEIYPKASIVYASVYKKAGVYHATYASGGRPFNWAGVKDLARVVTISHAGFDGPIFDYVDQPSGVLFEAAQPWGIPGTLGTLSAEGHSFWRFVGSRMTADGRVILLGCNINAGSFTKNVARAARRRVHAPSGSYGAGDDRVVIPAIRKLEQKAAGAKK